MIFEPYNNILITYLARNSKAVDPYEFKLSLYLAQKFDIDEDCAEVTISELEEALGFSRRKITAMNIAGLADWRIVKEQGNQNKYYKNFNDIT